MQNRIDTLFERKKENILSIFLTAGYPNADGPIIQQSSMTALNNGMTLKVLFEQLQSLRTVSQLPILLMGYINSVMQYGVEEFYHSCHATGIDGIILPDLPLDEFDKIHKPLSEKYNINLYQTYTHIPTFQHHTINSF